MRVHPVSGLGKRTLPVRTATCRYQQKKLRRLPHIFSRVLELPFASDADVAVEEGPTTFRFTALTTHHWADVRAHQIEIYPGVVKVVVRDGLEASSEGWTGEDDGMEMDRWRFRLPSCTRPALATADCVDGELVVIVPKDFDGVRVGKLV